MGSNRINGDLRPPARTPLKSNDIMENMRSVVLTPRGQCYAPSILSAPCISIQSSPNPNYSRNTMKGVPDSSVINFIHIKSLSKREEYLDMTTLWKWRRLYGKSSQRAVGRS
ncbi:hypothetical protein Tco_0919722 [Tanacetum coccineum]